MQKMLEKKLTQLIQKIKKIKKQLILREISNPRQVNQRIARWKQLTEKISVNWDKISVSDEIKMQREKSW